jgi:hypothetical protein
MNILQTKTWLISDNSSKDIMKDYLEVFLYIKFGVLEVINDEEISLN